MQTYYLVRKVELDGTEQPSFTLTDETLFKLLEMSTGKCYFKVIKIMEVEDGKEI